jgi:hypothetical protein
MLVVSDRAAASYTTRTGRVMIAHGKQTAAQSSGHPPQPSVESLEAVQPR